MLLDHLCREPIAALWVLWIFSLNPEPTPLIRGAQRTILGCQQAVLRHEAAHVKAAARQPLDYALFCDDALDELRGRHVKARVPHLRASCSR